MESWSLSNPKRDVSVCECSENNIKFSQCQRDISRHVQAYGLSINRDEISDEMDLILGFRVTSPNSRFQNWEAYKIFNSIQGKIT